MLVYYIEEMEETTSAKNAEKTPIFTCKMCDFECCKKSDYDRHTDTIKHKRLAETSKKTPKIHFKPFSCICGSQYFHSSSLAKHKRTCIAISTSVSSPLEENKVINVSIEDVVCSDNKDTITKSMFMELINDNKEMIKIIKEQQEQIKKQQEQIITIIPKIGNTTNNNTTNNNNNTTNNFNLNVFLNEQFKDALNISDFIDSLKITLEDLLFSKTNGISRGITDIMIKGLKELDIYKRPIHCTDIKRDIMYIKDEDKWCKDENHVIMKDTIVKIADKERTALQQWAIDNPDWMETERKQLDYLTMVRSICEPIENYYNYEKKILKNIGKEILVDKKIK